MSARYTLLVGTKNWSSWSLRPYLALRATGVPFEEEVIPLRRDTTTPALKSRSPSSRVPVLDIEESGATYRVWDSLAICETLAERHPDAALWPKDRKVRATARAFAAEMHSGFSDLRSQLSMDFARRVSPPALSEETRNQIARIIESWSGALAESGGPYLFGPFSIADCMYAPVVSRFRTYGISLPTTAEAYASRIFALPAMRDWGEAARREVEAGFA